jgi:hypothetical protein
MNILSVRVFAIGAIGAGVWAGGSLAATTRQAPPVLLGTWRLVEYDNWDTDGRLTQPYGARPRGYFVYDATGHVTIQIARTPPMPAPPGNRELTTAEKAQAYDSYVGYFGRYTVDATRGIVTHHVEGSLRPDYTDTDQPRPFRVSGDSLIVASGRSYRRVLLRVR